MLLNHIVQSKIKKTQTILDLVHYNKNHIFQNSFFGRLEQGSFLLQLNKFDKLEISKDQKPKNDRKRYSLRGDF